jgi:hypothetical protein
LWSEGEKLCLAILPRSEAACLGELIGVRLGELLADGFLEDAGVVGGDGSPSLDFVPKASKTDLGMHLAFFSKAAYSFSTFSECKPAKKNCYESPLQKNILCKHHIIKYNVM